MNFEYQHKALRANAIVFAIIIGLLISSLIILLTGNDPMEVFSTLVKGAFGSKFAIASTLRWTTPLLFTGVAAAFAFRAGMFNIGVEGQMYIGAFLAAMVGHYITGLPTILHILLCIIAGIIGGMIWVLIPALMKVYFNASELVTTLMMNYIAMLLTDFLVKNYFLAGGIYGPSLVTKEIASSAIIPKLWPNLQANAGLFIGFLVVFIFWFIIQKTKFGYEFHITGVNSKFAKYGGVGINKVQISTMLISGAIAGIGGAVEVMGIIYKFLSRFSPDFGFDGLVASLLGGNTPIGVLISSFFLGALKAGSLTVERYTSVSRALAMIIQGIIITFISCKALGNIDLKSIATQIFGKMKITSKRIDV